MKKFTYDPISYQNHIDAESADRDLKGATHVETYTKYVGECSGEKTIVIFAFYPDEEKDGTLYKPKKRR